MTSQEYNRLKEYFEQKITSLEKAVGVASQAMDRRLEGMNEFRDSLKDQSEKFVTKDEYIAGHDRVADDIRMLREAKANMEGKASMTSVFIAYGIAILSLIIGVIAIFHGK
jgi:hypothetical protein